MQQPTIHTAARSGDLKLLQHLAESHPEQANGLDAEGNSALHLAAWNNRADAVALLARLGADVAVQDGGGRSPLHAAAANGSVQALETLLKAADPCSKEHIDGEGFTALHAAVKTNQLAATRALKTREKGLLPVSDMRGMTAVHTATQFRSHDCLRELLGWSLTEGILKDAGSDSTPHPLRIAFELYDTLAVRMLSGAMLVDLEASDSAETAAPACLGWSPTHRKVFCGAALGMDADPIAADCNGATPFHLAAGFGLVDCLEKLIEICRDIKLDRLQRVFNNLIGSLTSNDTQVLHLVECPGETQQVLTEMSWDYSDAINTRDADGRTPLHVACQTGHSAVATLLLSKGADIDPQDQFSWTPLHHATDRGDSVIVSLLLSRDASPAATPGDRTCPVTLAAGKGYSEVLSLLLSSQGASVTAAALTACVKYDQIGSLKVLCSKVLPEGVVTPCAGSEGGALGYALCVGNLTAIEVMLQLNPPLHSTLILDTIRSEKLPGMKKRQILHFLLRKADPCPAAVLLAADLGQADCIGLLCDGDPTLLNRVGDLRDYESVTPLQVALCSEYDQGYRTLIQLGADPNASGTGLLPPLLLAIQSGVEAAVRLLLSSGASPNEAVEVPSGRRVPINSITAAVEAGSELFCKWLHKRGADLECRKGGVPPLLAACRGKKWGIAALLVTLGSSVNVFNLDSDDGEVGPIWYALGSIRERDCVDFIHTVLEDLIPPPKEVGQRALLQDVRTSTFKILQVAATRAALAGIRDLLSRSKSDRVHYGFLFDNQYAYGTTEVKRVLLRCATQVDALICVESPQQAAAVMAELIWKRHPPKPSSAARWGGGSKSGGGGGGGAAASGGYAADETVAPRPPPKRRAIIVFRCDVDMSQFNCVY